MPVAQWLNIYGNDRVQFKGLKCIYYVNPTKWKTIFLVGRSIFRGYVSFREGILNIAKHHLKALAMCSWES